jgi:DNA-binding transcriptional MerR regulator
MVGEYTIIMKVTRFAELADVSVGTVRRWVKLYEPYLTPSANPPKGETRVLSTHDQRVLAFVSTMRDAGRDPETIDERLAQMQADGWRDLPELPENWEDGSSASIPLDLAASRATEAVQLAVLQAELQHTRQALEAAQTRVAELEAQVQEMEREKQADEENAHALELALERARSDVERVKQDVARLEGQLSQFGRFKDNPVSIGMWLVGAFVVGLALAGLIAVILVVVL